MSLSLGPLCRLCPKLGQPRREERGVRILNKRRAAPGWPWHGSGHASQATHAHFMHTGRECKIHRERKTRYERLMWAAKTGNNTV